MTLLEVVVALAIFLMALVPVMRLISIGGERAMDVNHLAQASLLCQNKMDCVKAGAEPLNTSGNVDIGNLSWSYTIESSPTEVESLYTVKVTAHVERGDGKVIEESLVQMVFDPNSRGSTVSAAAVTAAPPTTPTTGGN